MSAEEGHYNSLPYRSGYSRFMWLRDKNNLGKSGLESPCRQVGRDNLWPIDKGECSTILVQSSGSDSARSNKHFWRLLLGDIANSLNPTAGQKHSRSSLTFPLGLSLHLSVHFLALNGSFLGNLSYEWNVWDLSSGSKI